MLYWKNRSMLLHHLSWTKCRKPIKSRILLMLIISHLRLMIVLLVSKKRSMLLHSLQNSPRMLLESEHAVTLSGRQYSVHCLKKRSMLLQFWWIYYLGGLSSPSRLWLHNLKKWISSSRSLRATKTDCRSERWPKCTQWVLQLYSAISRWPMKTHWV